MEIENNVVEEKIEAIAQEEVNQVRGKRRKDFYAGRT